MIKQVYFAQTNRLTFVMTGSPDQQPTLCIINYTNKAENYLNGDNTVHTFDQRLRTEDYVFLIEVITPVER